MPGLFDQQEADNLRDAEPLAARMRPRSLEEFVGQTHFLGDGKLLRRMLAADRLGSVLFYGPPGTGKTTLAKLIARQTKSNFVTINAAASSVKELRAELETARRNLKSGGTRTVLFIDELHRFNKAQQDVLLPDVETGVVTLIGATTANPFFSLVAPLVSRSQIFEFQSLAAEDVAKVLRRALTDKENGLAKHKVQVDDDAIAFLADISEGDARRALSALEIAVLSVLETDQHVTVDVAQESIQKKAIYYDGTGDEHYDAASVFIKSMRGGDPDAAVYWLARMLEAGEDPRFIARRIVILASEDIGNADPQALVVANAAAQATEFVGLPECRIILSHAVCYMATAPKSNAAYMAINEAQQDIKHQRVLPVPMTLRDKNSSGRRLNQDGQYIYPHNAAEGYVDQDYLGVDKTYYTPPNRGYEAEIQKRLAHWRSLQDKE